jgi:glyoxylase-like metal-dependent hydrolase (beta-lactamase superfamily II)
MKPPLELEVYTSPTRTMTDGVSTFSPVTSTLVLGETEALLVDAQFVDEDIDAIADLIDRSGRTLRTIYVTHGHIDHYFGVGRLLKRFPNAQALATPGVVQFIEETHDTQLALSRQLLGDLVTEPTSRPRPLDGTGLALDSHELQVIEVGQGDIAPSTVLYVPELGAVIAGDVVYNGIHLMLAYSTPSEWELWTESVNAIERLGPSVVVAGHKRPEANNDPRILAETRKYIEDFAEAVEKASSPREVISKIRMQYPDRGNLTTLVASASAAIT